MTAETIEGTAVEVEAEPSRAVVVAQPGQAIVASDAPDGPERMLERATNIATALARMVEAQRLYSTISGKKYPHVEAWQTIGRMDNVVARETSGGVFRHDDGSYEAHVELVRLSDGMVIGRASALCGTKDDVAGKADWSKRSEPNRRSMAVTRATSRAFRQQYAWVMALAGYEPTPAEEMPHEGDDKRADEPNPDGSLIGKVQAGKPPVDYQLRQTPDGPIAGFALVEGRTKLQVLASGPLADALAVWLPQLTGQRVKVWGSIAMIPWDKDGKAMPPYRRVLLERIETPDFTLPAVGGVGTPVEPEVSEPETSEQSRSEAVAPGQEALPLSEDERALIASGLPDA